MAISIEQAKTELAQARTPTRTDTIIQQTTTPTIETTTQTPTSTTIKKPTTQYETITKEIRKLEKAQKTATTEGQKYIQERINTLYEARDNLEKTGLAYTTEKIPDTPTSTTETTQTETNKGTITIEGKQYSVAPELQEKFIQQQTTTETTPKINIINIKPTTPKTTSPEETRTDMGKINVNIPFQKPPSGEIQAINTKTFKGETNPYIQQKTYEITQKYQQQPIETQIILAPAYLATKAIIGGAKGTKEIIDMPAYIINPNIPLTEKISSLNPIISTLQAGTEIIGETTKFVITPTITQAGELIETTGKLTQEAKLIELGTKGAIITENILAKEGAKGKIGYKAGAEQAIYDISSKKERLYDISKQNIEGNIPFEIKTTTQEIFTGKTEIIDIYGNPINPLTYEKLSKVVEKENAPVSKELAPNTEFIKRISEKDKIPTTQQPLIPDTIFYEKKQIPISQADIKIGIYKENPMTRFYNIENLQQKREAYIPTYTQSAIGEGTLLKAQEIKQYTAETGTQKKARTETIIPQTTTGTGFIAQTGRDITGEYLGKQKIPFQKDIDTINRAQTLTEYTGKQYIVQSTLLGEQAVIKPKTTTQKGFLTEAGYELTIGKTPTTEVIGVLADEGVIIAQVEPNTGQTKLLPDKIQGKITINPNPLLSQKSVASIYPETMLPEGTKIIEPKEILTQKKLIEETTPTETTINKRDTLKELYGKKQTPLEIKYDAGNIEQLYSREGLRTELRTELGLQSAILQKDTTPKIKIVKKETSTSSYANDKALIQDITQRVSDAQFDTETTPTRFIGTIDKTPTETRPTTTIPIPKTKPFIIQSEIYKEKIGTKQTINLIQETNINKKIDTRRINIIQTKTDIEQNIELQQEQKPRIQQAQERIQETKIQQKNPQILITITETRNTPQQIKPPTITPTKQKIEEPQTNIKPQEDIITTPRSYKKTKDTLEERKGGFIARVRKKGKFISLGEFSTSKEAFTKGRKGIEETASASLDVINKLTGQRSTYFGSLPTNIQPSKRETGVYIQKRETRISSQGEKLEITYKGQTTRNRGVFA